MGTIPRSPSHRAASSVVGRSAADLRPEGGRRTRSSPSGGKLSRMAKGSSKSTADGMEDQEAASVNTGDPEAALFGRNDGY